MVATSQLALMALRLIAAFVAMSGFMSIGGVFVIGADRAMPGTAMVGIGIATVGVPILAAALLWAVAPWIARRASAGMSQELDLGQLSETSVATAALVVAGTTIFMVTAPTAISYCARIIAGSGSGSGDAAFLITVIVKAALALLVIFRARPLANYFIEPECRDSANDI